MSFVLVSSWSYEAQGPKHVGRQSGKQLDFCCGISLLLFQLSNDPIEPLPIINSLTVPRVLVRLVRTQQLSHADIEGQTRVSTARRYISSDSSPLDQSLGIFTNECGFSRFYTKHG